MAWFPLSKHIIFHKTNVRFRINTDCTWQLIFCIFGDTEEQGYLKMVYISLGSGSGQDICIADAFDQINGQELKFPLLQLIPAVSAGFIPSMHINKKTLEIKIRGELDDFLLFLTVPTSIDQF